MHGIACNKELGIEPNNGRSKSVVFYLLASQGLALEGSNYLPRRVLAPVFSFGKGKIQIYRSFNQGETSELTCPGAQ